MSSNAEAPDDSNNPNSDQPTELSDTYKRELWSDEAVSVIDEEARALFEGYSAIPSDQVIPHILHIREKAYQVFQYGCIGQLRFIINSLRQQPFYSNVVASLKQGGQFMDAGCCFGQVARYLIAQQGISPSQVYGFDVKGDFMQLGHELFRDEDRLRDNFIEADVLQDNGTEQDTLKRFDGGMDVVYCGLFLHCFDWNDMLQAARRLVKLTRPTKGSIIAGKSLGSHRADHYQAPILKGVAYRHNEESMRRFWKQVSTETDSEWVLDTGWHIDDGDLKLNRNSSWSDPEMDIIWFYAVRAK